MWTAVERDFEEIASQTLPWGALCGKRILCTGATGFIGRYFASFLCWLNRRLGLGMDLWLLRRPETPETIPGATWITGQITDAFIPLGQHFHIIIHMASPARARAYSADPAGVVNANILATRYLLEYAKQNQSVFLFFSSGEVNPDQNSFIPEALPSLLAGAASGLTIYSACKLAGELLCEAYHNIYGTDCRIIRPFNVRGPGEPLDSDRTFPNFIREIVHTGEITVRGNGLPVRDSCYLSDLVSGVLYVLLKGQGTGYSLVHHIGNEESACTILEAARKMAKIYGHGTVNGPLSKSGTAGRDFFVPDTTRLRSLGWRPRVDLDECIRRCLEGYSQEKSKKDPRGGGGGIIEVFQENSDTCCVTIRMDEMILTNAGACCFIY